MCANRDENGRIHISFYERSGVGCTGESVAADLRRSCIGRHRMASLGRSGALVSPGDGFSTNSRSVFFNQERRPGMCRFGTNTRT